MIFICEPQCVGFEHAPINAALIETFRNAFPSEKVVFFAERQHLSFVSQLLSELSVTIECREIGIPVLRSDPIRLAPTFLMCAKIFRTAHRCAASTIVFCSITSPCLISIKLLMKVVTDVKCVVTPHSILDEVSIRRRWLPRRPLKHWFAQLLFSFRPWFTHGNSARIRYLILGEPIMQQLVQQLPQMTEYLCSIDHPYVFQPHKDLQALTDRVLRFGFFGVASMRKGVDLFFEVAKSVKGKKTKVKPEFVLIGYFTDQAARKFINDAVSIPSPDIPLDPQSYDQHARSVDYAVYFHDAAAYNLIASGALFDAFSYVKPILVLKSPSFEYYFSKMGDIGYLCASAGELENVILAILDKRDASEYLIQQKNILTRREQFSPVMQSRKLETLWEKQS